MSYLSLAFLGQFQVVRDGQPLTAFETDKVRGLLAYLAVEAQTGAQTGGRAHSRNALATLLWPEHDEESARTNLRHTLHQLRQAIGDSVASPPLLLVTRQTLQFNPAADSTLDVAAFSDLIAACAVHDHVHLAQCQACLDRLGQAVQLYQGGFLEGLAIKDGALFEEWRRAQQEQLHIQALNALRQLADAYEARQEYMLAQRYALRQLEMEPWREEAYRQLMRVLAASGQRSAALAQYHLCCQALAEELNSKPAAATSALYEQIRSGAFPQQAMSAPNPPAIAHESPAKSPIHDLGEMPAVELFHGRAAELAALERALLEERCRLVMVLGIGGAGKTALVAKCVQRIAAHYDFVIWRSLLNAPPLAELLPNWLQILARQSLTNLPDSQDEQMRLLMDSLRRHRCLLILDNMESIMQTGERAGQPRPGYEGYGQLLERLGASEHSSSLLITSRERPQGLERLAETSPTLVSLYLSGLDVEAGQQLLQDRGLTPSRQDAMSLVQHYSGNPLALQIVANTIVDLFGGDIGAFPHEDAPVFDSIRAVLDEQFSRLSSLEREILLWLAIEREAVTVPTLRGDLVQPPAPYALLEALRSLQRRSLLEKAGNGFTLQNVVIEYTTDYLIEQVFREIGSGEINGAGIGPAEIDPAEIDARAIDLFNRHALLKAEAKEYIRQSQERLILRPLGERLRAKFGQAGIAERAKQLLAALRRHPHGGQPSPGYAAGNLLNLLLHLGINVRGYDFSGLTVWQAYLQGVLLPEVNFSGANLAHSVFTPLFGKVGAMHFDEAGQLVVAGLVEGRLCLWRAADSQLLHEYQSLGADGASLVAFSPTGRILVSAHPDNQIRVWDGVHGRLLTTIAGQSEIPWTLIVSPDGQTAATSGTDRLIYLWDLQNGCLRKILRGHPTPVPALAFSPDGRLLASGDVDGAICLWDIESSELLCTLRGHSAEVHVFVFDPSGNLLVSGSHDATIRVWQLASDRRSAETLHILQAHTAVIRAFALSDDGRILASGGDDTFVCLWEIHSGQLLHTLLDTSGRTGYFAFSPDHQTLAIASWGESISLWRVASGQRLNTFYTYSSQILSLDICPDPAPPPGDSWQEQAQTSRNDIRNDTSPRPPRQLLAGGGSDSLIYLWELAAPRQVIRTFRGYRQTILTLALSPDGRTLAAAGSEAVIRLWDVASGEPLRTLVGHGDDVESIQFSPDSRRLVSASRDQSVRVWDVQRGHTLHTLLGHSERVHSCAFSPDGRLVASGSIDRMIYLWDVSASLDPTSWQLSGQAQGDAPFSPRLYRTLNGHINAIRCVDFSPDGALLVSSSFDQSALVWDLQSGQVIANLPVQKTITSIAFHPNGALLATGAKDHTVQLWDLTAVRQRLTTPLQETAIIEARLLHTLLGHTYHVQSVRFSLDGAMLASGSVDGTIRLWDAAGGDCLHIWQADGPYAGMKIGGVTGISPAAKSVLIHLGALETDEDAGAATQWYPGHPALVGQKLPATQRDPSVPHDA